MKPLDNVSVESLRQNIFNKFRHADFDGDAFLESFLIVEHTLGKSKSQVIVDAKKSVAEEHRLKAYELTTRRLQGEPMAYLLGYKDFYTSRFVVKPGILIPRPETELLVEKALAVPDLFSIADLGSGSGCIGLSLLKDCPQARLWTCDISSIAGDVTKQNATRLGVDDRIIYEMGDVVAFSFTGEFDLIVSNPPYIDVKDPRVQNNVRVFEPELALFAEEKGLAFYKDWIPWSFRALKNYGVMIFEFGQGQSAQVREICELAGFEDIKIHKDTSEIERDYRGYKEGSLTKGTEKDGRWIR